jgi:hypothetical protein
VPRIAGCGSKLDDMPHPRGKPAAHLGRGAGGWISRSRSRWSERLVSTRCDDHLPIRILFEKTVFVDFVAGAASRVSAGGESRSSLPARCLVQAKRRVGRGVGMWQGAIRIF